MCPRNIQTLFRKSEIGDTDTFKFILFAVGKNMSPHLLLNFHFIKYQRNPGKIPKHKHSGQVIPSLRRNTCSITLILPNWNISIWMIPLSAKTLKYINILWPFPYFHSLKNLFHNHKSYYRDLQSQVHKCSSHNLKTN